MKKKPESQDILKGLLRVTKFTAEENAYFREKGFLFEFTGMLPKGAYYSPGIVNPNNKYNPCRLFSFYDPEHNESKPYACGFYENDSNGLILVYSDKFSDIEDEIELILNEQTLEPLRLDGARKLRDLVRQLKPKL